MRCWRITGADGSVEELQDDKLTMFRRAHEMRWHQIEAQATDLDYAFVGVFGGGPARWLSYCSPEHPCSTPLDG